MRFYVYVVWAGLLLSAVAGIAQLPSKTVLPSKPVLDEPPEMAWRRYDYAVSHDRERERWLARTGRRPMEHTPPQGLRYLLKDFWRP